MDGVSRVLASSCGTYQMRGSAGISFRADVPRHAIPHVGFVFHVALNMASLHLSCLETGDRRTRCWFLTLPCILVYHTAGIWHMAGTG
jgi:hypothetical protein